MIIKEAAQIWSGSSSGKDFLETVPCVVAMDFFFSLLRTFGYAYPLSLMARILMLRPERPTVDQERILVPAGTRRQSRWFA
jgi:hypothetical protein